MDFTPEAFNTAAGRFSNDSKELFQAWSRRGITFQQAQSKLAEYLFGYRDLHELQKRMEETFGAKPAELEPVMESENHPVAPSLPAKSGFTLAILGPEGSGKSYHANKLLIHALAEGYKVRILFTEGGNYYLGDRERMSAGIQPFFRADEFNTTKEGALTERCIEVWNSNAEYVSVFHEENTFLDVSRLSLDQCGDKCLFICDEISHFKNIPSTKNGYAILLAKQAIDLPYTPEALIEFDKVTLDWMFGYQEDLITKHFLHLMRARVSKDMRRLPVPLTSRFVENVQAKAERARQREADLPRKNAEHLNELFGVLDGLVKNQESVNAKASYTLAIVGQSGSGKTTLAKEFIQQAIVHNLKVRVLSRADEYEDACKRNNGQLFSKKLNDADFMDAWNSDESIVVGNKAPYSEDKILFTDFSHLNLAGNFVLICDEIMPTMVVPRVAGGVTVLVTQHDHYLPKDLDAILSVTWSNGKPTWSLAFSENENSRKMAETMGLEALIKTSTEIVEIAHRW